jgi:hypothetical protein
MYNTQYIFILTPTKNGELMKQLVSLSVHLMEPSASQLNSSFKRLDL